VRAVVLGPEGEPELADVAEPDGEGALVRVLACGLCGSDVEKMGDPRRAGAVLGHEVVALVEDGRSVALVHHSPCGECHWCRDGHESLCDAFASATIVPGGFAERVRAQAWVELPAGMPIGVGSMAEPLACVLRGAQHVPRGRVLVVGHGFIGHLFAAVLRHRGDEVFAVDVDPRRHVAAPREPVDATVLCGRGGIDTALEALRPGGTMLVFADAGVIPAADVYRRELMVIGSRSATPALMIEAIELLRVLPVPEPTVLPLERFAEGLDLFRRRDALKVVFTP